MNLFTLSVTSVVLMSPYSATKAIVLLLAKNEKKKNFKKKGYPPHKSECQKTYLEYR
jgi:hypothetical protein